MGTLGWITKPIVPNFLAVDTRTAMRPYMELPGVAWPFGDPYMTQLDVGLSINFTALRNNLSLQTVLYKDSGLDPGNPTTRITNASNQTLSAQL